ncbi:MAG: hypothetical protein A2V88_12875 [Elusimicrobia bacterium RBG_16_66_12]|nr:MAG: hypothetical protein A2V88_12875 [Elusimicrobia bacterium RBG_16_66_12]
MRDRVDVREGIVACPRCGEGRLVKHCPPEDRCGWWWCDLPCGFALDLILGTQTVLHRVRGGVSSARDDGPEGDAGEGA